MSDLDETVVWRTPFTAQSDKSDKKLLGFLQGRDANARLASSTYHTAQRLIILNFAPWTAKKTSFIYWLAKGNLLHVRLFGLCLPTMPFLVVHFLHLVHLKCRNMRGKKRCKISNLHYRACSDSLPTMCVFCARAFMHSHVYACVCGQKICFHWLWFSAWGGKLNHVSRPPLSGPSHEEITLSMQCHLVTEHRCLVDRLAALPRKWTSKMLENVNVQKWLPIYLFSDVFWP